VTLQNRVDQLMRLLGRTPLEHDLMRGAITHHDPVTSTPGLSDVYHVRLASGQEAFHKPFAGVLPGNASAYDQTPDDVPINECSAWLIARELGPPFDSLVPTGVLRQINGEVGSLCSRKYGIPHDRAPLAVRELVLAAGFFDGLVAQQDRHLGNYRWDPGPGSLGLIDHGYAFARPGDLFHRSVCLRERHNQGWARLEAGEHAWLDRIQASGDLMGLQLVLPTDRAVALQARVEGMIRTGEVTSLPTGKRWP